MKVCVVGDYSVLRQCCKPAEVCAVGCSSLCAASTGLLSSLHDVDSSKQSSSSATLCDHSSLAHQSPALRSTMAVVMHQISLSSQWKGR